MPHNLIFLGLHFAISKRTLIYVWENHSVELLLTSVCLCSICKRLPGYVREGRTNFAAYTN